MKLQSAVPSINLWVLVSFHDNNGRTSFVTSVLEVRKPVDISSCIPLSVTPLFSRLAERLFVTRWLIPAKTRGVMDDLFGFRQLQVLQVHIRI